MTNTETENTNPGAAGWTYEKSILRIINAFAVKLIALQSNDDLAWYLAREVVGKMGFADCVVYFLNEDGKLLRQRAAIGEPKNPTSNDIVNALEIPLGEGITGHVARTKEPLIVADLREDPRYISDVELARSEICVPLFIDDRVVGVIDCEDKRVGHFNDFHLEILSTVASMASAKLKSIKEGQAVEIAKTLAQTERRFRDFAESGSDWFWETDGEDRFTWFSHDSAALQAMLGQRRWDIDDSDDALTDWDALKCALKTQQPFADVEFCVRQKDGSPLWVSANARPLFADDLSFLGYRGTARDVTGQRESARELLETNRRLQAITDTSPNIIVISRLSDGMITFANPATYTVSGYKPEDIINQVAPDFYAHSEDRGEYVRCLKENKKVVDFKVQLKKVDGSPFWTLINSSVVELNNEPHIISEIVDITFRKSAEDALRESEETFHSFYEIVPDVFVIADLETGRCVDVNSGFCRTTGYGRDEVIGRRLTEIGIWEHEEDRAELVSLLKEHDIITNFSAHFRNKDGASWPGIMSACVIQLNGTPHLLSSTKDVSDIRRSERKAISANQAKSEFLSSMSHELRTPMNAILGFAQLLDYNPKEPLSKGQRASVESILKGGNHLLELIDQVLELNKIEAGKLSLHIEHVSARDIINESLNLIRPRAEMEEITIIDQTAGDDLPLLLTDSTRLTQVLLNLLSNAVKYNREGGTVRLASQERAGQILRISVIDNGRGIPVEKQDDLFKPFERLGRETGPIEGTGIGLTITRQIVELLGGTIGYVSEEDKGSTFWIDVPVGRDPAARRSKPAAPVDTTGKNMRSDGRGSARTILYVEDNPANMRLLEAIVARIPDTGMLTAFDAESGIDLAKCEQPDLILMDINLPGMNGFEALAQLRDAPETTDIPVIAITAAAMPEDVDAGLMAGFKDYITKPIKVSEFIRAVEQALGTSSRPR